MKNFKIYFLLVLGIFAVSFLFVNESNAQTTKTNVVVGKSDVANSKGKVDSTGCKNFNARNLKGKTTGSYKIDKNSIPQSSSTSSNGTGGSGISTNSSLDYPSGSTTNNSQDNVNLNTTNEGNSTSANGLNKPIANNNSNFSNQKQTDKSAIPKQISGGVVNGKAGKLVAPVYPAAARAVNVRGAVNVQVVIDEDGKVISAYAVKGHPLLQPASVKAALESVFSPTLLCGYKVKVSGIIVYNFQ